MALAPALALFTRIQGPQVLAQENRNRIYEHIHDDPGIHFSGLRKELALSNGVLTHHLYTLERERLIRKRRQGRRLRFFPIVGEGPPTDVLDKRQGALMRYVASHPGCTQSDAARAFKVSRQTLHYHVGQLRESGLIEAERQGRETRLRLALGTIDKVRHCPACKDAYLWERGAPREANCPACKGALADLRERPAAA